MFCASVLLPSLLSLALSGSDASSLYSHSQYNVPYQGPPAPLNHDGTVAFTPEFQQANAVHNAAYAEEYKRLQEVESLAAAHPDRTSPPSSSYKDGQYNNQQSSQQYSTHSSYNSAPQQPTSYTPAVYNPQAHSPAPLNHDGTVAQTPEYNAIAASLHAAYDRALTRHRRSFNHYQGPPAPLNYDGTVANTQEVQHATAAHHAAVSQEYQRLQEAERLAAAHPDLTSPSGNGYGSSDEGHYNGAQYSTTAQAYSTNNNNLYSTGPQAYTNNNNLYNTAHYSQEQSHRYNPQAHIPAPLNYDGTVAQTPEYLAIAARHHAEYQKAVQRNKYQSLSSQGHGYY